MKILAIRGKNLASLEDEFEIDFTEEPLKSAGIFAITGSTGSGKSTLLDALCLALFDDTPRTNSVAENNIQISDIKDRTVNQKDSRNILRRGTGDGYAEVDFMSLGGDTFRSRWSVRRSRDRADGILQSSELKLINLTANIEEHGRKTELLAKIVTLIGLTFHQFTRAVLLAQGDFAAFLKAAQKEKAELLEKLTGTDIYSRISAAIYEKSRKAEQELSLIRERIKDIELLSDSDVENLIAEKQSVIKDMDALSKDMDLLSGKLKWIAEESVLNNRVREADMLFLNMDKAIEEAKPRYDYLAKIDSVQGIRDSFNDLKTLDRQLAAYRKDMMDHEKLRDTDALLLKQYSEKIYVSENSVSTLNREIESIEPEIKRARELDIQIAVVKSSAEEVEKDYKQAFEKRNRVIKSLAEINASLNSAKQTVSHIESWFHQNEQYREIIPRVELIVNIIDDAVASVRQKDNNTKTLIDINVLLDSAIAEHAELILESERLNRLLPSEIAALRMKLETGKPCPVCGSEHHPYSNISAESLEEAKLNSLKKDVTGKIVLQNDRMDSLKNERIRLTSVIENYTVQSNEAMNKLHGFLAAFNEWKVMFDCGILKESLLSVADTWRKNELAMRTAKEHIANFQANLDTAKEQLAEIEDTFITKSEKYKNVKSTFEQLLRDRTEVLKGRAADDVERYYAGRKKELADTLFSLKEENSKILAVNEKREGIIKQISREILRLSDNCISLQKIVDEWILSMNGSITLESLSNLLSRDNSWVIAEREQLNRLHQSRTAAWATLTERKKTLDSHHLLENRPAQEETADILRKDMSGKQEVIQHKTVRHTEVDLLLASHNRDKERVASFERELTEKAVLSENWKKLNEMFGSADGAKFKILAQGYTLDVLLAYANRHLYELSRRYRIQRIADTLALQVVDLDMLGEVRTVHSLSGGESFLISLALALGLSSLSSNRMKVESLFIDEGFGSLDIDTLRIAMDALERLQTQGRKMGVISHVEEMTERINARINVIKTSNGKSKIEISGAR